MTSSDLFQPSWSYNHQNNDLNSILGNVSEDGFCMGSDDTCYTIPTSMEETYLETTMLQERCMNFPVHLEEMGISTEDVLVYFKDPISNIGEITDVSITRSFEESKAGSHSSQQISSMPSSSLMSSDASLDVTSMPSSSLVLPTAGVVFDNELTVFHLIVAYVEAKEMGQKELAEKIVKRIGEKVSPVGETGERLLYFMFHDIAKQSGYLKQKSVKNFYQAFKAFYQIFPYGKFAHFLDNLAFLESLPDDADIIHIIDFDIGEGIQWASLIEAIGHQRREVTLTSVKFVDQDDSNDANPLMWRFEDAKKRLLDHARSHGLKLKMDEMELADLVTELKNINQKLGSSSRREFFVFNCMAGLPHTGRVRSRRDVFEFLGVSQNFLQIHAGKSYGASGNKGVITFGDGDPWEKVKNASNYGSFLDGNMTHYQALLESIKLNFPCVLVEARTAMECLFVAPFVSSLAWAENWEESKKYGHPELRFGLEGLKLSRENLMEAREVVREGESLYGVRIQGESHNEMVLDWRGIPMIRVSCWRS